MKSPYRKRIFIGLLLGLLASVAIFFIWISDKYVVPILVYHHIDGRAQLELTTVSPQSFDQQMAYIKKNGFKVMSFNELVEDTRQGIKIPPKSVVLSFDDGYEDNFTHALPILKKYGFSGIFFLPSDLIGKEGFMTWDQVRVMVQNGMEIGSHTETHIYLPTYPSLDRVVEEIRGSKTTLEKELKIEIKYFCYPSGGFDDQIKEFLKQAGYKGACTTNRGEDRYNKDVYELKRIRMKDNNTSNFDMRAKLSGYYNLFRKLKKSYSH